MSRTTDALAPPPLKRRRILIVEDEAIVAADIEQRLEALGYDVCGIADTSGGAISGTHALRPDLVLMDIHLIGDRDGVYAATQIRESSGIPVVFLTAHADDDTLTRLCAAAPFGFILKPFAERELKATIEVAFYRQQAEIQVSAWQRWLITSLSSIGDGVIAIDLQGKVKFINPTAQLMTGWPRESALGQNIIDVFALEQHGNDVSIPDLLDLAFRQGAAIYLESGHSLKVRDGRQVHVDDSIAVIRDEHEPISGWVITFRDVTSMFEEEKKERRLEEKMTEASRLRALSVLAGAVARDFNDVLYGIATGTSIGRAILATGGDETPARFRDLLDRLDGAAGKGAHLCGQLLAYAGQIRLSIETLELNALTRAAVEVLGKDLSEFTNLVVDLADDLPLVPADAVELRQIIMNLLLNAYEALQGGAGRVVVQTARFNADAVFFSRCRVGDDLPAGEYVLLSITDSGCGMGPELMARIFDPFFTTKSQGRGLSLAVAAGIVRSFGGALRVDSTFGKGTCFQLALPAAGARSPRPDPQRVAKAPSKWSGHLLLVDDDPAIRPSFALWLKRLGFTVEYAQNGGEALAKVLKNNGNYRFVCMDLTMPEMSGREAFEAIRGRFPILPFLITSGHADDLEDGFFDDQPLTAFLQKPFSSQDLAERLPLILGALDGL